MEITDVKIFLVEGREPVLAYANVVLNNALIIRGITLLEFGKNRRHISMPSRRLRREEKAYRDMCHPINSELRDYLTKELFAAYEKAKKESK